MVNERTEYHTYFHYGRNAQNEASFGGKHKTPDLSENFHTYAMEWDVDLVRSFFDGKQVGDYARSEVRQARNMYLILNLAVGGWAEEPVASDYPAAYEIDYVRVYQHPKPEED